MIAAIKNDMIRVISKYMKIEKGLPVRLTMDAGSFSDGQIITCLYSVRIYRYGPCPARGYTNMFFDYDFRNYNFRLMAYMIALNVIGVLVVRSATNKVLILLPNS